eukprot:TRINITY_DN4042_c0_g3_i1.p1 TRINITY_DN4042_c0_g3~~TRINITY_DN4042_c0_g3_i1.p1  ORF type:complete len:138 (-),score=13.13 TRINITY_DN4042_c0_g3_i1:11-424(-)
MSNDYNPFNFVSLSLTFPPSIQRRVRGGPDCLRWSYTHRKRTVKFQKIGKRWYQVQATSNETSTIIEPIFESVKERLAKEKKQNQDQVAKELSSYKEKTSEERQQIVEEICLQIISPVTGCINELISSNLKFEESHV